MTLNEKQQQFYDYVSSISQSSPSTSSRMIRLVAPGGTGKTHTIKQIYRNSKGSVKIIAPTHKACSLFQREDVAATTIHKFMHATRHIDDDGNVTFPFNVPEKRKGVNVIIVDECSMISSDMYNVFLELCDKYHIVFVGDNCQIPPVNEDYSPVFNATNMIEFTFTENMRSRDSLSNLIVENYRRSVSTRYFPGVQEHEKILQSEVVEYFKQNQDAVILSWRNARVSKWNTFIHDEIHKDKPVVNPYMEGDRLVFSGVRTIQLENGVDSFDYHTSDIITIKSIRTESIEFEQKMSSYQIADYMQTGRIRKCRVTGVKGFHDPFVTIRFWAITDGMGVEWYIPYDEENKRLLSNYLKHWKSIILHIPCTERKSEWVKYYNFKETYDPNLRHVFSSTVHKAQGSQWDNVFVDMTDISSNFYDARYKLAYTAVSRMVRNVKFIIEDHKMVKGHPVKVKSDDPPLQRLL